jgi:hypothetical protein
MTEMERRLLMNSGSEKAGVVFFEQTHHHHHLPSHMVNPSCKGQDQDPPKRCVSAYNLFFQVERQRLINKTDKGPYTRAEVDAIKIDKATRVEKAKRPHRKMHGMISFTDLAKNIAQKWKDLNTAEKRLFEERAEEEKKKYAVELEEWLLRQVPTQQVRKRLSALRRGSLSKYITHRRESLTPTPTCAEPVTSLDSGKSVHGISPYSSSSSLTATTAATVSPEQGNRRMIQIQRARNLQRLYQMQISLYNEQMRIHNECKADMAALYKEDALSPQDPSSSSSSALPLAPLDSPDDATSWDDAMTPSFPSILPQYSLYSNDQFELSAFHHDGRVSPFEQDTKVFA